MLTRNARYTTRQSVDSQSSYIAMIDDDLSDQILLQTLAQQAGVRNAFKFFEHGEVFLEFLENSKEKLEKDPPEMIIVDLNMPRMDGIELLEKIKCNPIFSNIPVVVFSASLDHTTEEALLKLGARKCCSKFSSFNEIKDFLLSVLSRS